MFVKSKLIPALAIRNRAPVATTRGTRATHWLGYTDKTHLRGLKNPNFLLVRVGGLCLCSSELYSPKTFKTSSHMMSGKSTTIKTCQPLPLPYSKAGLEALEL